MCGTGFVLFVHGGCDCQGVPVVTARALITTTFSFQDLVANGALVSICNKYGEMPVDKAKAPLRELLRGLPPAPSLYARLVPIYLIPPL